MKEEIKLTYTSANGKYRQSCQGPPYLIGFMIQRAMDHGVTKNRGWTIELKRVCTCQGCKNGRACCYKPTPYRPFTNAEVDEYWDQIPRDL